MQASVPKGEEGKELLRIFHKVTNSILLPRVFTCQMKQSKYYSMRCVQTENFVNRTRTSRWKAYMLVHAVSRWNLFAQESVPQGLTTLCTPIAHYASLTPHLGAKMVKVLVRQHDQSQCKKPGLASWVHTHRNRDRGSYLAKYTFRIVLPANAPHCGSTICASTRGLRMHEVVWLSGASLLLFLVYVFVRNNNESLFRHQVPRERDKMRHEPPDNAQPHCTFLNCCGSKIRNEHKITSVYSKSMQNRFSIHSIKRKIGYISISYTPTVSILPHILCKGKDAGQLAVWHI